MKNCKVCSDITIENPVFFKEMGETVSVSKRGNPSKPQSNIGIIDELINVQNKSMFNKINLK